MRFFRPRESGGGTDYDEVDAEEQAKLRAEVWWRAYSDIYPRVIILG